MTDSNRYGIARILGLMTMVGVFAWTMKLALDGSQIAALIAASMLIAALPFAVYSLFFLLAYPFGLLNYLLDQHTKEVQSPFATDRLPEQQFSPTSDPERAH